MVLWEFGGVPGHLKWVKKAVKDYNATHKDIQIELEFRDWATQRESLISTTISGEGPDIIRVHHKYSVEFGELGGLYPLDNFEDFPQIKERILDNVWEQVSFEGKHYGLPVTMLPFIMAVNKGILDEHGLEIPQTWEEVKEIGPVLKADGMLRLIEEYRKAGKIRFVGLTGHTHPANFTRMIGEYEFDTILNPVGAMNRVWNDFTQTSLAAARAKGMGTIGMKVMAYGQVPPEDKALYLRYAMSQAIDVAIVGMDTIAQVEENAGVADGFAPLTEEEERELLERALALVPTIQKELWWLPEQRVAG